MQKHIFTLFLGVDSFRIPKKFKLISLISFLLAYPMNTI